MELHTKYLKDYKEFNYNIESILLEFKLVENQIYVKNIAKYQLKPNSQDNTLYLDGEVHLIDIKLNNKVINSIEIINNQLILYDMPNDFTLEINTVISPWNNKSCMGIYISQDNIVSQCEAEGFRRITFFPDRPDVMTKYTTVIKAPIGRYNKILSNGNLINKIIDNDYEVVTWEDPYKKPSYLFALVLGNFIVINDEFITKSKKKVLLQIYADNKYIGDLNHAMNSIKRAMSWDENRFNLEYDLERYMIVATTDFNMGAMENKGLNIFNTKYVIANKNTATDQDFINVEAVIGHEYFHNWTGNRVTCKNWFQLSLKEGLTVFRDQEFTADLHDRVVKRIEDVLMLKNNQFPEDSGPLAHPVRPFSYIQMNNFYTMTVYEKGAEIIRMYQTILGADGFKKGLELYFQRFDGMAATVEDFYQAMSDANCYEFKQFIQWYNQFGTPEITISDYYDETNYQYILDFKQSIITDSEQYNLYPLLIPIEIGLLDNNGFELINLQISHGEYIYRDNKLLLLINNWHNRFIFDRIKIKPIPSLLRNFSAPVKLNFDYNMSNKLLLIKSDSDYYNRFALIQDILKQHVIDLYHKKLKHQNISLNQEVIDTIKLLITDINLNESFRTQLVTPPNFNEILTLLVDVTPHVLLDAIDELSIDIGERLFDSWIELYNQNLTIKYDFKDHGKRSLKNIALFYIIKGLSNKFHNNHTLQLIETITLGQFNNSDNMTDEMAVLYAINNTNLNIRQQILNKFYQKWCNHELVMDKWLMIQASNKNITINDMLDLMKDKVFIAANPNKVYALLRTYTYNCNFHSKDGYDFITTQIMAIDKFNPQLASSLMNGFSKITKLSKEYKLLAKNCLQIMRCNNLSTDVGEKIDKIYNMLG